MWRVFGSDRSRRHTSKPDSFGIIISSRMRSGFQSRARESVSSPLAAIFVSNPLPSRWASSRSAFGVSSSAIRMRGMGSSGIVAAAVIICTACAILNPKHDNHSPPCEVENGAVIPCYETPSALAAIRTAARGRRRVHAQGTSGRERGCSRPSTILPTSPICARPPPNCAGARGSSPRERWPTVFPYGPNPAPVGSGRCAASLLRYVHAHSGRHLPRAGHPRRCTPPNSSPRRSSTPTFSRDHPATTPSAIAAAVTVTSTTPLLPPSLSKLGRSLSPGHLDVHQQRQHTSSGNARMCSRSPSTATGHLVHLLATRMRPARDGEGSLPTAAAVRHDQQRARSARQQRRHREDLKFRPTTWWWRSGRTRRSRPHRRFQATDRVLPRNERGASANSVCPPW